jgi:hypothetical protein
MREKEREREREREISMRVVQSRCARSIPMGESTRRQRLKQRKGRKKRQNAALLSNPFFFFRFDHH